MHCVNNTNNILKKDVGKANLYENKAFHVSRKKLRNLSETLKNCFTQIILQNVKKKTVSIIE